MTEYHNRPAETAATFWTAPDGRRFVRTGDIGRFDGDGFLELIDRKKDLIISGGFNVYPSDLETILLQHPRWLRPRWWAYRASSGARPRLRSWWHGRPTERRSGIGRMRGWERRSGSPTCG
jgi:acyl-CoA synthetase (AMP-forming)/AMP-acid ligase II